MQQATAHPSAPAARSPASRRSTCPTPKPASPSSKARLAKTIDYVKAFKPAQIDGTEDKEITLKLGANERKFTG